MIDPGVRLVSVNVFGETLKLSDGVAVVALPAGPYSVFVNVPSLPKLLLGRPYFVLSQLYRSR